MKHRFITLMLLLLGATFAIEANPVDIRTAREVGLKFMNANTKALLHNADELQWVTTYNTNRGDAAFYVFNTQDGFVIVSADDCATPILGYSSEGHFDTENIPIQLQEYLQGFVEQIGYGIENHVQADKRTAEQWERVRTTGHLTNNRTDEAVEPLITTKWDQYWPYNDLCPEDEEMPDGHMLTGCTATAMAQIMKYWEWPLHGTGEHSYQWNGQTLSANFGETTYNWDNMLDEYIYHNIQYGDDSMVFITEFTQEQMEAVATLMWHCGVSVEMNYTSTNGSGAMLYPESLIDYFAYSDEMSFERKRDFSDATWKAKLKDCLNLRRPLYYVGYDSIVGYGYNGHAFVCDGYDSNDLFHFNWGWGSVGGYYAIGALNPGAWGWNYLNRAIFNIHPQGETTYYAINVSTDPIEGGVVSGSGTYAHGDSITLTAIPNEGYGFCYWEENGEIFSANPTFSFTANYNRDFRAVFASLEENVFFNDLKVMEICLDHWDTNGDGKLSYAEAAAVTSLGEVFRGNERITSFEELEFFTGLTSIDDSAFFNCISLYSTIIPNTVISIGNYAFAGCCVNIPYKELPNLTFSNSVTTIGDSAFEGSGFWNYGNNLIIPNSVTTIGNRAFADCLTSGRLIIGDSVTTIGTKAFQGCSGFTGSLTIGNSVTTIGSYAFQGCSGFTGSLTIPDSVTEIGYAAFQGCSGWTGSLTISNSLTTIGKFAFSECSGFTGSLIIPNSVTSIANYAFQYCSGLESLTIPNSVTLIGDKAFFSCHFNALNINMTNIPMNFASNNGHSFTGTLTIGDAVTSIGDNAFSGCQFNGLNINISTIPIDFVHTIGGSFTGTLTIGDAVTSIGENAFDHCSGFTGDLTIPNSVTTIGDLAFRGCSGFNGSLTIGNSVVSIGNSAFLGCSGLSSITVLPETPPSIESNSFYNVNPGIVVKVPCGCLQAYKTSDWNDYFTSIMQNCIGISEDHGNTSSIYPNPTNGQVKIEAEGIEHITISNELGQVIYESKASGNTFEYNFSRHEAGTYLIKIETKNGITTKRVAVTR